MDAWRSALRLAHGQHFPAAEGTVRDNSRDDDHTVDEVMLRAGCNIQQGATSFCRGALGVRPLAHPVHPAADEASNSCSKVQRADASDNQMIVTTTDGQVLAVSMTDAEVPRQKLDSRRTTVEQKSKWVSSRSASVVRQLQRISDNCSHSSGSTADSTLDNRLFQHVTVGVLDCILDQKP